MLRHMGMETIIGADPASHFLLRILSILKIVRACIDIRERNHVVGVRISTPEQCLHNSLQFLLLGDSAVVYIRYQPGHLTRESRAEELAQVGEKDSLGFAF